MATSSNSSNLSQVDVERKLLAVLCQSAATPTLRATIVRRLQHYNFSLPDHTVIYRALAATPPLEPPALRQALTQTVTRMGFPDLDLSELFEEVAPLPGEAEILLTRL